MNAMIRNPVCALLLCAFASFAMAEVAVIVNTGNTDEITAEDVQKIYLAKTKTFPNGKTAIPVDQTEGSAVRIEFLSKVIKKDEAQMKSYWTRLIFTGKGVPPNILPSDEQVKDLVSRNVDAIGFINAGSVDDSVRVIGTF